MTQCDIDLLAGEIFNRCGEPGLAGVVLRSQEAAANGDWAQVRQWRSIAQAMLRLVPEAA